MQEPFCHTFSLPFSLAFLRDWTPKTSTPICVHPPRNANWSQQTCIIYQLASFTPFDLSPFIGCYRLFLELLGCSIKKSWDGLYQSLLSLHCKYMSWILMQIATYFRTWTLKSIDQRHPRNRGLHEWPCTYPNVRSKYSCQPNASTFTCAS